MGRKACTSTPLASRGDPLRRLTPWVPPCSRSLKEARQGSRLGFPGRRHPRGPAALGKVARTLQVLPKQGRLVSRLGCLREGEGRWAWTRQNLVCGRPGEPPPGAKGRWGMAVLLQKRPTRRGSTGSRQTDPCNVPPGKTRSTSPPGLGCQTGPERGGEGAAATESATRRFSADEG
jgi:hypothetical protein